MAFSKKRCTWNNLRGSRQQISLLFASSIRPFMGSNRLPGPGLSAWKLHFYKGFTASKCDPSLFIFQQATHCILVLVYVDDILVTGSSLSHIQALIDNLHTVFVLKQLGNLDYFLGVEVSHLSYGSLLSQSKYIRDLLCKAHMNTAKGINTPMAANSKMSRFGSDYVPDPTTFRSIVGALQYATLTRPEISYSVNKVYQLLSQPLKGHWKAVKRILRYLRYNQSWPYYPPCILAQATLSNRVLWCWLGIRPWWSEVYLGCMCISQSQSYTLVVEEANLSSKVQCWDWL